MRPFLSQDELPSLSQMFARRRAEVRLSTVSEHAAIARHGDEAISTHGLHRRTVVVVWVLQDRNSNVFHAP